MAEKIRKFTCFRPNERFFRRLLAQVDPIAVGEMYPKDHDRLDGLLHRFRVYDGQVRVLFLAQLLGVPPAHVPH